MGMLIVLCLISVLYVYCSAKEMSMFDITCNNAAGHTSLPSFLHIMHDGHFHVNLSMVQENGFSFADVQLVKRNPNYLVEARNLFASIDMVPFNSLAVSPCFAGGSFNFNPYQQYVQSQDLGEQDNDSSNNMNNMNARVDSLVNKHLSSALDHARYAMDSSSSSSSIHTQSEWCRLSPPCSSRVINNNICSIPVNPLDDLCVVLPNIKPTVTDETAQHLHRDKPYIVYQLQVPMLEELSLWKEIVNMVTSTGSVSGSKSGSGQEDKVPDSGTSLLSELFAVLSGAKRPLDVNFRLLMKSSMSTIQVNSVCKNCLEYILFLPTILPTYLICMVFGVLVFSYADDIAGNNSIQLIIMTVGGIMVAAATFVMVVYS